MLIIIDNSGNMSSVPVTPPSLGSITSNILYVEPSGNLGVLSSFDIYTLYPTVKSLLTVDANNVFSTISSSKFNPCHVNSDLTMNGTPQRNGTCACRNNWTGTASGNGCAICDAGGDGVTHLDNTFGELAGPDCQYSRTSGCSGKGKVTGTGQCQCDANWTGSSCSIPACQNGGIPNADNTACICPTIPESTKIDGPDRIGRCAIVTFPSYVAAGGQFCENRNLNSSTRSPWGSVACPK